MISTTAEPTELSSWREAMLCFLRSTRIHTIFLLFLRNRFLLLFCLEEVFGKKELYVPCKKLTPGVVHYLLSLGLDPTAADYHGTVPQDLLVQYAQQHLLAFVHNFISGHQPFLPPKVTLAMARSDTDTIMLRKMGKRLPQDSLTL